MGTIKLPYLLRILLPLWISSGVAVAQYSVSGSVSPSVGRDLVGAVNASRFEVLRNSGNGRNFTHLPYLTGLPSNVQIRAMELGDVDGDGREDLVFLTGSLYVAKNSGNGTFLSPTILTPLVPQGFGSSPMGVRLVDLDQDGDLDIIISHVFTEFGDSFSNDVDYAVLDAKMNDGTGSFGETVRLRAYHSINSDGFGSYFLSKPWRLPDGTLRIAIAGGEYRGVVATFEQTSPTSFISRQLYNSGVFAIRVNGIGDFDGGDGYPDLLISSRYAGLNRLGYLLGGTAGEFTASVNPFDHVVEAAAGDFDGDWRGDWTALIGEAGQPSRYALTHFADDFKPFLTVTGAADKIHVTDLTGDGADEVVTASPIGASSGIVQFHPSSGADGTFGDVVTVAPPALRTVRNLESGYLREALSGFSLGGITAKLIRLSDESIVATTATDLRGEFHFANIPNGSYRVEFTRGGFIFSPTREESSIVIQDRPFMGVRYLASVAPPQDDQSPPGDDIPASLRPLKITKLSRNTRKNILSFRVNNIGPIAGCSLVLGSGEKPGQEKTVKRFTPSARHRAVKFAEFETRPLPQYQGSRFAISVTRICPGHPNQVVRKNIASLKRGSGQFAPLMRALKRTVMKAAPRR